MAAVFSPASNGGEEGLLRHIILNSIRMYNVKYRAKYGRMIIACDDRSWRKNVYKEYKASRKTTRDASTIDWESIFETLGKVKAEIDEFMPFPILQAEGAEADDIIGVLVESTQDFGQCEDVMIVSADKDFAQLQKYPNIAQFSPMTKKKIVEKNPTKHLFDHVLRGDASDGVPNVLSSDDIFITEGTRQTPLKQTVIDKWREEFKTGKQMKDILDEETYKRWLRNSCMIDLSKVPKFIVDNILEVYKLKQVKPNSKVLNYLIKNKCLQLVPCADDFFIK